MGQPRAYNGENAKQSVSGLARIDGRWWDAIEGGNLRPHLGTLLWYDCKADLVVTELEPGERTERIEGCRELCPSQSVPVGLQTKIVRFFEHRLLTCEGMDVVDLRLEAHRGGGGGRGVAGNASTRLAGGNAGFACACTWLQRV